MEIQQWWQRVAEPVAPGSSKQPGGQQRHWRPAVWYLCVQRSAVSLRSGVLLLAWMLLQQALNSMRCCLVWRCPVSALLRSRVLCLTDRLGFSVSQVLLGWTQKKTSGIGILRGVCSAGKKQHSLNLVGPCCELCSGCWEHLSLNDLS